MTKWDDEYYKVYDKEFAHLKKSYTIKLTKNNKFL